MLHYANVSDMVLGREPAGGMVLQQPKVRAHGDRGHAALRAGVTPRGCLQMRAGDGYPTHP